MSRGKQVLLGIALLSLLKFVAAARVEPSANEAYHWLYARHPALGYFNHPPLLGWMLWGSIRVFGDGLAGLRVLPILCSAASMGLIYLTGRKLYTEDVGRLAAFLVGCAPDLIHPGSAAYPEAPLLLFWTASLWALAHALGGGRPAWWLASGAFLGLALLSKYPAGFIGLGMLLFLLLSPEHRRWLRRPEPYLAALAALAIFSPVILWNATHEWASFRYQTVGRFEGAAYRTRAWVHRYPLTEIIHLTPIVALWAWNSGLATVVRWRLSPWQDRLAASLSVPLLLFLLGAGGFRSIHGHWTVPAHPALLLLAAAAAQRRTGPWIRRGLWGSVAAVGLGLGVLAASLWRVPDRWVDGWAQLAREVSLRNPAFVLSPNYHVACEMAYHLRPIEAVDLAAVGKITQSFSHWWEAERWAGRDTVIVLPERAGAEAMEVFAPHFERFDAPVDVQVIRFWGRTETFRLIGAHGYRPP